MCPILDGYGVMGIL